MEEDSERKHDGDDIGSNFQDSCLKTSGVPVGAGREKQTKRKHGELGESSISCKRSRTSDTGSSVKNGYKEWYVSSSASSPPDRKEDSGGLRNQEETTCGVIRRIKSIVVRSSATDQSDQYSPPGMLGSSPTVGSPEDVAKISCSSVALKRKRGSLCLGESSRSGIKRIRTFETGTTAEYENQESGLSRWEPKKFCEEDENMMLSSGIGFLEISAGVTDTNEIRAIQRLPQPPIHKKFYLDRHSRKQLKIWLWHPTDKRKAKKWLKARRGSWSLDCDGSFRKGKFGRYGSVIRDDKGGSEIFVYGKSPKIVSALYHEVESIYETVQVAESYGIRHISIRTDCKRVVELLTKPGVYATPKEGRQVWHLVDKLKLYLSHYYRRKGCSVRIRHQHREMNNLADYVAGLYNGMETRRFIRVGSFDETTRYFIARDIAGLPYYWDRDRQKAEKKKLKESQHK